MSEDDVPVTVQALRSPLKNQGYHYNQNAEIYLSIGQAIGLGTIQLLKTTN